MIYKCQDCAKKVTTNNIQGRPPVRCADCRKKLQDRWRSKKGEK